MPLCSAKEKSSKIFVSLIYVLKHFKSKHQPLKPSLRRLKNESPCKSLIREFSGNIEDNNPCLCDALSSLPGLKLSVTVKPYYYEIEHLNPDTAPSLPRLTNFTNKLGPGPTLTDSPGIEIVAIFSQKKTKPKLSDPGLAEPNSKHNGKYRLSDAST